MYLTSLLKLLMGFQKKFCRFKKNQKYQHANNRIFLFSIFLGHNFDNLELLSDIS